MKACRVETLPVWKAYSDGKLAGLEAVIVNRTRSLRWAQKVIQIISDGKMFYTEVVRLVETIDFDIKIVPIQGRMQKLEPAQRDPPVSKNMTPGIRHICGYV